MYQPRKTLPLRSVADPGGVKLYTISASGSDVDFHRYSGRLDYIKQAKGIDESVPAFAILHDGAVFEYLIVGWWKNENELFLSVSVRESDQWIEDFTKYSLCIWDLDIVTHEKNSFIRHLYSGTKDLKGYRQDMKQEPSLAGQPAITSLVESELDPPVSPHQTSG